MKATRRALLGTATAAAAAKPRAADPDAALRAAAIEFLALDAEYRSLQPLIRSSDDVAGEAAFAHCDAVIWPRQEAIIDTAISAAAVSPRGLRAKAAILQTQLLRKVPQSLSDAFEDCAEDHERLAMSLAHDVLALEVLA